MSEFSDMCRIVMRNQSAGDDLLTKLSALSNAHRLRIIHALHADGRRYVSDLARHVGISRPLLYLHLQKLEAAGLVRSHLTLSDDGKALNWFEVCRFNLEVSPVTIAEVAGSLSQ